MLYTALKVVLRLALDVFHDTIEVRNPENIPPKGPTIFVANHPSSIMDALMIGTVIPRRVSYLGHSGLFANPAVGAFLRRCGVVPIHPSPEDPAGIEANERAFQACYDALEAGDAIGIFPEGISLTDRRVLKVKTGAARIALGAERRSGYKLGVRIVPLGLYFTDRRRFRGSVLLNFGRPIPMSPFLAEHRENEWDAVRHLTGEIQERLESVALHVRKDSLDELVRSVDVVYKEELRDHFPVGRGDSKLFEDLFITQHIADASEYFQEHEPARVGELEGALSAYTRKLSRVHLRDKMLRKDALPTGAYKKGLITLAWGLAGLPLFLAAVVTSYAPYKIAEWFGHRMRVEPKTSTGLFLGGALAFVLFYTAEAALVWIFISPAAGTFAAAALPANGFLALAYRRRMRRFYERWRFLLLLSSNRQLVRKLRRERHHIILLLNDFKEDYLRMAAERGTSHS